MCQAQKCLSNVSPGLGVWTPHSSERQCSQGQGQYTEERSEQGVLRPEFRETGKLVIHGLLCIGIGMLLSAVSFYIVVYPQCYLTYHVSISGCKF